MRKVTQHIQFSISYSYFPMMSFPTVRWIQMLGKCVVQRILVVWNSFQFLLNEMISTQMGLNNSFLCSSISSLGIITVSLLAYPYILILQE